MEIRETSRQSAEWSLFWTSPADNLGYSGDAPRSFGSMDTLDCGVRPGLVVPTNVHDRFIHLVCLDNLRLT